MTFKPLTAACTVMALLQDRFTHVCAAAYNARQAYVGAKAAADSGQHRPDLPALKRTADGLADAVPLIGDDLRRAGGQFSWMLGRFPAANDERYREPEDRA